MRRLHHHRPVLGMVEHAHDLIGDLIHHVRRSLRKLGAERIVLKGQSRDLRLQLFQVIGEPSHEDADLVLV